MLSDLLKCIEIARLTNVGQVIRGEFILSSFLRRGNDVIWSASTKLMQH